MGYLHNDLLYNKTPTINLSIAMKSPTRPNPLIWSSKDQEITYLRKTIVQLSKSLVEHPEETTLAIRLKISLKRLETLLNVE